MLRIKSFKISEGEKMSEFLRENIIAKGANIYVSNGEIAIPYEDCTLPNNAMKRGIIAESLGNFVRVKDEVVHSNKVIDADIASHTAEMESYASQLVTNPKDKKTVKENKELEHRIKTLQNMINQAKQQAESNRLEINRIDTNVEVYNKTLEELKD